MSASPEHEPRELGEINFPEIGLAAQCEAVDEFMNTQFRAEHFSLIDSYAESLDRQLPYFNQAVIASGRGVIPIYDPINSGRVVHAPLPVMQINEVWGISRGHSPRLVIESGRTCFRMMHCIEYFPLDENGYITDEPQRLYLYPSACVTPFNEIEDAFNPTADNSDYSLQDYLTDLADETVASLIRLPDNAGAREKYLSTRCNRANKCAKIVGNIVLSAKKGYVVYPAQLKVPTKEIEIDTNDVINGTCLGITYVFDHSQQPEEARMLQLNQGLCVAIDPDITTRTRYNIDGSYVVIPIAGQEIEAIFN